MSFEGGSGAVVRAYLVDDHEIVRRGLSEVLDHHGGIEIVGEAGTVAAARDGIAELEPGVAVLDDRLGDGDGIELCRTLRVEVPATRCLILTSFVDRRTLDRAVAAGAAGFLLKTLRSSVLVDAIRRIAAGENLIDEATAALAEPPSSLPAPSSPLNDREATILELVTDGLTNQQIAEELGLSAKTVANNLSTLFAKLGMQRRAQAAAYGARLRRERSERGGA